MLTLTDVTALTENDPFDSKKRRIPSPLGIWTGLSLGRHRRGRPKEEWGKQWRK